MGPIGQRESNEKHHDPNNDELSWSFVLGTYRHRYRFQILLLRRRRPARYTVVPWRQNIRRACVRRALAPPLRGAGGSRRRRREALRAGRLFHPAGHGVPAILLLRARCSHVPVLRSRPAVQRAGVCSSEAVHVPRLSALRPALGPLRPALIPPIAPRRPCTMYLSVI